MSGSPCLNFPSELRAVDRWVGYRLEKDPDRPGKFKKIPVNVRPESNCANASSTDAATWSTFDDALAAIEAKRVAGPGFVFTNTRFFGTDLDNCIDEDGAISANAQKIIEAFPAAYWELSPSGQGVHGIGRGTKPEGAGCKVKNPFPGIGAIEVYDRGRFFTMTGAKLPSSAAQAGDCQEALDQLCAKLWPAKDRGPASASDRSETAAAQLPDPVVMKKMLSSKNGAEISKLWLGDRGKYADDDSSADSALMAHLAYWTAKNSAQMLRLFDASKLADREKWRKRADYRERTVRNAIETVGNAYRAEKNEEDDFDPRDLPAFEDYAASFANARYAVERFLVEGTLTVLVGDSASGKSTLATALGWQVSRGEPFAGLAAPKRRVLLLDGGENPYPVVEKRLRLLRIDTREEPSFRVWGDWERRGAPRLFSAKMIEYVEASDPRPLVLVDSLGAFFAGKSENDNAEIRKFFKDLRETFTSRGATVIVMANRGKDSTQRYRGASSIKDSCDAMWVTEKEVDDKNPNLLRAVRLDSEKLRIVTPTSFSSARFVLDEGSGAFAFAEISSAQTKASRLKELFDGMLAKHPGGVGKRAFSDAAVAAKIARRGEAEEFLGDGVLDGTFDTRPRPGNGIVYIKNAANHAVSDLFQDDAA